MNCTIAQIYIGYGVMALCIMLGFAAMGFVASKFQGNKNGS